MKINMLALVVLFFILSAFVASHVAVYFSFVRFFGITDIAIKNILLWSLVFLGSSFFISTFFAHQFENSFSRFYYLFANFWMGLLVNLVLFLILAWIIIWVSGWVGAVPKEKLLGILVILASLIYSVYGAWNAFSPKITKMEIMIDSLPKEWVGKKIVQISDVHLGHVYREKHFINAIEKINALEPEVVVFTGDLFDGTDGSLKAFLEPINNIKAPAFFITGNHETYLGIDDAYDAISKTKLIPLRDSLENINGLQFIGIDYPLKGGDRDISKLIPAMKGYDQFAPSILLIHEPVQIEAAKKVGISLQLSGHTHVGQLFPFSFITSAVFKGYDYGFKREGSFAIYTSSGFGGWGPPMRTEKRSEIVEITLK
ncbi:MAG: Metallophosphoesterase [uncultured bacterium]|nr:MAG: Metallophosphoesterase [uncultured bacterium]